MRSLLYALLVAGVAWKVPAYSRAVSGLCGSSDVYTILIAAIAAFAAPWLMTRAFMNHRDAAREAADQNSRPDYYDTDHHHWHRNPQTATADSIKAHYFFLSLGAWLLQGYLAFRSFYY